MDFICQKESIMELQKAANYDSHSILISGPTGCGKSFLARLYGSFVGVSDVMQIVPTVASIKESLQQAYQLSNNLLVVIENLDTGVPAASYALLKFIEEPKSNIYVVVTCRSVSQVPDTILSRCGQIFVSPPTPSDIENYGILRDASKYDKFSRLPLWKCVRYFTDVDLVYLLNDDCIDYFNSLLHNLDKKDSISNLAWMITHYSDNTESPIEFVIRYIMCNSNSEYIRRACIDCLNDLDQSRISQHAIISRFLFEYKYGG